MQLTTQNHEKPLRLHRATLAFIGVVAVIAAAALTIDSSIFSIGATDQLDVAIWALALILACTVAHALYVQRQATMYRSPQDAGPKH